MNPFQYREPEELAREQVSVIAALQAEARAAGMAPGADAPLPIPPPPPPRK